MFLHPCTKELVHLNQDDPVGLAAEIVDTEGEVSEYQTCLEYTATEVHDGDIGYPPADATATDGQAQASAVAASEAGDDVPFSFECKECKKTLSGTRFVTARDMGGASISSL